MAPGVTNVASEAIAAEAASKPSIENGEVKPLTANDAKSDVEKPEEDIKSGMECDIHNLYQKQDERGRNVVGNSLNFDF